MFEKLDKIKPAIKHLVQELLKEYAYASVLAVEDENRGQKNKQSRLGRRLGLCGESV